MADSSAHAARVTNRNSYAKSAAMRSRAVPSKTVSNAQRLILRKDFVKLNFHFLTLASPVHLQISGRGVQIIRC